MTSTAPIVIDWLGGNCPVEAEGTIAGRRFYYRARWRRWVLAVSRGASGGYETWSHDDVWRYSEDWGIGPYEAGWMEEDVARSMIEKAAALYTADMAKINEQKPYCPFTTPLNDPRTQTAIAEITAVWDNKV